MQVPRFVLLLVAVLAGLLVPGGQCLQAEGSNLIDVKVSGTGPTAVVFISGLATPGSIWDDTVAALQKDATSYVVSLAGFGGKPPVKREHLLVDARDEIIAYLRAQKIDHPVIVGHSLGGVLALDIAAKAPDLPGRLIIVDGLPFFAELMSPGIETEAAARKLAAAVTQGIGSANAEQFSAKQKVFISGMVTSPAQADALSAVTGKSDPATVAQAMSELIGRDLRPELPSIKCPVLVLGALADKVDAASPKERVERDFRQQYKNLPQARFQFFDHARHFIMIDDPAGLQATIRAELAQVQ